MKNKGKDAKWEELAQKHEFLFGKKPRKNMKIENLEKKVQEEVELRGSGKSDDVEIINPAIPEKMSELLELSKEDAESTDGKQAMLALVATNHGVHMAMAGEGEDIAIMIATSMSSQPMIAAVVSNAAIMYQMRQQQVAQQMKETDGAIIEEVAPEGLPKPQTEA